MAARTPSARADALGRLGDGLDHLEYQAKARERDDRDDEDERIAEEEGKRAADGDTIEGWDMTAYAFEERAMSTQSIEKPCSFPECPFFVGPKCAKGLCMSHYAQHRKGKPLTPLHSTRRPWHSPPRITFAESPCSEWGLSKGLTTPCHIFTGSKNKDGYGSVRIGTKTTGVHIYVWVQKNGPVPKGLEIDHICRVRPCCNADHLRAVTHQFNSTQNVVGSAPQLQAAKTHCPQGHPYDSANTARASKKGGRSCRQCKRDEGRRRRLKNKETTDGRLQTAPSP